MPERNANDTKEKKNRPAAELKGLFFAFKSLIDEHDIIYKIFIFVLIDLNCMVLDLNMSINPFEIDLGLLRIDPLSILIRIYDPWIKYFIEFCLAIPEIAKAKER